MALTSVTGASPSSTRASASKRRVIEVPRATVRMASSARCPAALASLGCAMFGPLQPPLDPFGEARAEFLSMDSRQFWPRPKLLEGV